MFRPIAIRGGGPDFGLRNLQILDNRYKVGGSGLRTWMRLTWRVKTPRNIKVFQRFQMSQIQNFRRSRFARPVSQSDQSPDFGHAIPQML